MKDKGEQSQITNNFQYIWAFASHCKYWEITHKACTIRNHQHIRSVKNSYIRIEYWSGGTADMVDTSVLGWRPRKKFSTFLRLLYFWRTSIMPQKYIQSPSCPSLVRICIPP